MKSIQELLLVTVIGLPFALAACGGGGSEPDSAQNPAPPSTGTAQIFSGRVIFNAPISGAKVTIKDAEGRNWQATTGNDGTYQVELSASARLTLPAMVQAQGEGLRWDAGANAKASEAGTLSPALVPKFIDAAQAIKTSVTLYAIANDTGTVHVTPASTLVVDQLTGNRAESAFLNLGTAGTSIAKAFDRNRVQSAQVKVKDALVQLGLPAALVDDPNAGGLVEPDFKRTYEFLVSGDVLSAAGAFLKAVVDNSTDYGCAGLAWGTMTDDGQRRPSCLPGSNLNVGYLSTNFMPLRTTRSKDVDVRATELAGGEMSGWKYQFERLTREQRVAALQAKLAAAIGHHIDVRDVSAAAAALERLCKSVKTRELSNLSYAYLEMKANMPKSSKATGLPVPDDPAKDLIKIGVPSEAVNRVVPMPVWEAIPDGIDVCPITSKGQSAIAALIATQTPVTPARPPLAPMLASLYAMVDALELLNARETTIQETISAISSVNDIGIGIAMFYPTVLDPDFFRTLWPWSGMLEKVVECNIFGWASPSCTGHSFNGALFKAIIDARVNSLPPGFAAGQQVGNPATASTQKSQLIAEFLIDAFEQRFADYYDARANYRVVEVQGYVVDGMAKADARNLVIDTPDASKITYTSVAGGDIRHGGHFTIRRERVSLPAKDFKPNEPAWQKMSAKLLIDPGLLPALAACYATDEACLGRLRRLDKFTPAAAQVEIDSVVTLLSSVPAQARDFWRAHLGIAAASHGEVLEFRTSEGIPLESLSDN